MWKFDGNLERPSFTPSFRGISQRADGSEYTTCHIIVTAGIVNFMADDPHLPNQQHALPDFPY